MNSITSSERLEQEGLNYGFLPFFKNAIEGFSIEENTPQDLWFSDTRPGPWEWKGPVIGNWQLAYGKFFDHKAGYVSLQWLPHFMNWRRHKYALDKIPDEARHILDTLKLHESALSHDLKEACGYSLSRRRKKTSPDNPLETIIDRHNGADFDKIINILQMGTWVCIADFEYKRRRDGETYGWGVARYCTPEAMYGLGGNTPEQQAENLQATTGECSPEESLDAMCRHLSRLLPQSDERQILKLIG